MAEIGDGGSHTGAPHRTPADAVRPALEAVRKRPLRDAENTGLQVVSGAMPPQAFATVAALMERLYRADAEMAEAAGERPRNDGRDADKAGGAA